MEISKWINMILTIGLIIAILIAAQQKVFCKTEIFITEEEAYNIIAEQEGVIDTQWQTTNYLEQNDGVLNTSYENTEKT